VSIPINEDDILTIDAGFSAYTSASSSNGNPFDISAASANDDDNDDDDDDDDYNRPQTSMNAVIGSLWLSSTGASRSDVWTSVNADYFAPYE